MALSPYLNPTNLNGALVSSSKVGEYLYGESLDKRNGGLFGALSTVGSIIDSVKDVTDSIENLKGNRSPMYKIGDITDGSEDWGGRFGRNVSKYTQGAQSSWWVPDEIKGLVRAVSSTNKFEQEGIIIDGIGEADGNFSISFSSNPVLFRADQVVDNRFREPAKLTMTVFVSNYLNDDGLDVALDAVSALDPTGLLDGAKNMLAYDGNTRAQYALYKLRHLMENAKPFQVYTPHGIYDNMLIKSIKPQTRPDTMDMLYCTVDFQEMILYTPLSMGLGKQPTRKGVEKERPGWTELSTEKLKALI